jgi:hypothetical protein
MGLGDWFATESQRAAQIASVAASSTERTFGAWGATVGRGVSSAAAGYASRYEASRPQRLSLAGSLGPKLAGVAGVAEIAPEAAGVAAARFGIARTALAWGGATLVTGAAALGVRAYQQGEVAKTNALTQQMAQNAADQRANAQQSANWISTYAHDPAFASFFSTFPGFQSAATTSSLPAAPAPPPAPSRFGGSLGSALGGAIGAGAKWALILAAAGVAGYAVLQGTKKHGA